MRTPRLTGPIVVGVDGSGSSLDAVRWAARAAELRRLPLRLVSAYRVETPRTGLAAPPSPIGSQEHTAARTALAWASVVARRSVEHPDRLTVVVESREGAAASTVLRLSSDASMVVVGSHGNGEYFSELLGSVSTAVAVQAVCPAVIVPAIGAWQSAGGPVVLALEGVRSDGPAVGWAFEEASLRRTKLLAARVSTSELVSSGDTIGGPAPMPGPDLWAEVYPDVEVDRQAVRGNMVEAIARLSHTAQAVVVEWSGRGESSDRRLGSTIRSLAHLVDCPLIVVRG